MGKRISRVVTRTGDNGTTGLADGTRIAKSAPRIEAIGAVDALNSHLGVFLAELDSGVPEEKQLLQVFRQVQNRLFDIGGELSMPGTPVLPEQAALQLEQVLEEMNGSLPALRNFILPGGSRAVALCHVVRAEARTAERRYIALCEAETDAGVVNPASRVYLNRLSDLCFVVARWLARQRGEAEVLWEQSPRP